MGNTSFFKTISSIVLIVGCASDKSGVSEPANSTATTAGTRGSLPASAGQSHGVGGSTVNDSTQAGISGNVGVSNGGATASGATAIGGSAEVRRTTSSDFAGSPNIYERASGGAGTSSDAGSSAAASRGGTTTSSNSATAAGNAAHFGGNSSLGGRGAAFGGGGSSGLNANVGGGSTTAGNHSGGVSVAGNSASDAGVAGNSALPSWVCSDPIASICSNARYASVRSRNNFLIALDQSGSMNAVPTGGTVPKWTDASRAIRASLDPNNGRANFGLLLFPYSSSGPVTACETVTGADAVQVALQPASTAVPTILDVINASTPGGGTPTAVALNEALNYYTSGPGSLLAGAKHVILVTDGGPNCNVDVACGTETCTAYLDHSPNLPACWNGGVPNCCDPAIQTAGGIDPRALCLDDVATTVALTALKTNGIDTYVVGIPGTEAYASYLDRFAMAGGVPVVGKAHAYYQVANAADLATAIASITTPLQRDCLIPLTEAPADLNQLNVTVDCQAIPRRTGNQVNWSYDPQTVTIAIQGPYCSAIEDGGARHIDVIEGCPAIGSQ